MNAHDIIIKPVLTEKSYEVIGNKTYVFIVNKKAGKTEIKQAIETIFDGVKVEKVNTVNHLGKIKRQGRFEGRRPSTKKAYITLTADSKTIEAFDNMAQ